MAAPKKRGRQAAMEQLAEKQYQGGGGGGGLLSPPVGGGGGAPSFGASAPIQFGGATASSAGVGAERSTFAERVGDVKENAERARAEYRARAAGALGAPPSSGPSAVTAAMHHRFSNLEANWGEVMDYVKIDPFSTSTPGLDAASKALSRNRHGLDEQTNAIIADLWDGVTSGQARTMTDSHKDDLTQSILRAPGGRRLAGGNPELGRGYAQGAGADYMLQPPSPGLGLALQLPSPHRNFEPQDAQLQGYPPPAGAQDFETRRQLEIMRQDILRLEEAVLQAVEAEEEDMPPPPPLKLANPLGISNMNRAAAFEDIVSKIKTSVVGIEPDSGGTPCNSSDDPNVPLIMPPRGGMKIRQQIEALQKETQDLMESTVAEIGGEGAARRMREMREAKTTTKAKRRN